MSNNIGKVVQVIGPVVDVRFASEADLPAIYNAIHITGGEGDQKIDLVVEVMQHLGDDVVRCVAMDSTDASSAAWLLKIRAVLSRSPSAKGSWAVSSTSSARL